MDSWFLNSAHVQNTFTILDANRPVSRRGDSDGEPAEGKAAAESSETRHGWAGGVRGAAEIFFHFRWAAGWCTVHEQSGRSGLATRTRYIILRRLRR